MNIHIFCQSATLLIQLTWVSKIECTVISISIEEMKIAMVINMCITCT